MSTLASGMPVYSATRRAQEALVDLGLAWERGADGAEVAGPRRGQGRHGGRVEAAAEQQGGRPFRRGGLGDGAVQLGAQLGGQLRPRDARRGAT